MACWFDVLFRGSQAHVVLSTSPFTAGTHWYQCRLLLSKPIGVNAGQVVTGRLVLTAHEKQSYFVDVDRAWAARCQSSSLLRASECGHGLVTDPK